MAQSTLTTERRINFKNWYRALYTIPRFEEGEYVDPVTRWLIAMRAAVLVMTAISGLLGGLLVLVGAPDRFSLGLTVLTTLGLVLAHAGSNLINDYWDARHGIDTPDSPRVNYGPQAFVTHDFTLAHLLAGTALILAMAAAIGIYLTTVAGLPVLAFMALGAALLLFYSGDPFPLKYRGLGELTVLIVWGPLMVGGTYYIQARELPGWVILASLPYALGVTTVLFGKHLDKIAFDAAHGTRTLVVILGETSAKRLTLVLVGLMYVLTLALVAMGVLLPTVLLVFLALPLARLTWRMYTSPKPSEPPPGYTGWPLWYVGATFVHNRRFGGLYLAGIILHILICTFILRT